MPLIFRDFDQCTWLRPISCQKICAYQDTTAIITEIFVEFQLNDFSVQNIKSSREWVNLGDLSLFACLPIPRTCGPEGGSFSVWMKISPCAGPVHSGFITSLSKDADGFFCRCANDKRGNFSVQWSFA